MIEVAMSQGKVENAIYIIPQLKSSHFDKKNQIFLQARSEVNRAPGVPFSFRCLRFFYKKLTNPEIVNPQVNSQANSYTTRYVGHTERRK